MRLGIVTSREYASYHADDAPLVAALRARGVAPEPLVWNDPAVDWAAFDALLVRTPWDYYQRIDEFLPWLARIEALGVTMVNPPRTLRWNADKRYLLELAAAGIPIVGTHWVDRRTNATLASIMDARGWDDVVVKPAVSGGAWRTWRTDRRDLATHESEFGALVAQCDMLVQAYVAEIASSGEWSLLFFGGAYSHAVLKRPRAGDFRVQEKHGGETFAAVPPPALIAAAAACVARLPALGQPGCLYARVDGVVVGASFFLMELELIEPQLFLAGNPAAGAVFADVLVAALF